MLQAERLHHRLRIAGLCGELRDLRRQLERSYELGERSSVAADGAGACCYLRMRPAVRLGAVTLERRVEVLEEENRNLRRRTH